jgi:hypothetical protein
MVTFTSKVGMDNILYAQPGSAVAVYGRAATIGATFPVS